MFERQLRCVCTFSSAYTPLTLCLCTRCIISYHIILFTRLRLEEETAKTLADRADDLRRAQEEAGRLEVGYHS